MDAVAQTVKNALDANPEMRLVLEIAARSRELQELEPPIDIGIATDTVTIPVNSQHPVPTGLPG
jgi:hypothetical protein